MDAAENAGGRPPAVVLEDEVADCALVNWAAKGTAIASVVMPATAPSKNLCFIEMVGKEINIAMSALYAPVFNNGLMKKS